MLFFHFPHCSLWLPYPPIGPPAPLLPSETPAPNSRRRNGAGNQGQQLAPAELLQLPEIPSVMECLLKRLVLASVVHSPLCNGQHLPSLVTHRFSSLLQILFLFFNWGSSSEAREALTKRLQGRITLDTWKHPKTCFSLNYFLYSL